MTSTEHVLLSHHGKVENTKSNHLQVGTVYILLRQKLKKGTGRVAFVFNYKKEKQNSILKVLVQGGLTHRFTIMNDDGTTVGNTWDEILPPPTPRPRLTLVVFLPR